MIMEHSCICGQVFSIVPKEIPLSADYLVVCDCCGLPVKGRWSTRFFDYEPVASALSELKNLRVRMRDQLSVPAPANRKKQ
jgi:hypothetical protein